MQKLKQLLENPAICTINKLIKATKTQEHYNHICNYFNEKLSYLKSNTIGYENYIENLTAYKTALQNKFKEA